MSDSPEQATQLPGQPDVEEDQQSPSPVFEDLPSRVLAASDLCAEEKEDERENGDILPSYFVQQQQENGGLPEGWTMCVLGTDEVATSDVTPGPKSVYYVNHVTRVTQWEEPAASGVAINSNKPTKGKGNIHSGMGIRKFSSTTNGSREPALRSPIPEPELGDNNGSMTKGPVVPVKPQHQTPLVGNPSAGVLVVESPQEDGKQQQPTMGAVVILRESVTSFAMILVIVCVVAVLFSIIDSITLASIATQSTLLAADTKSQVAVWLREKVAIIKHHEYVYRTGQFNARDMIVHPRYAETNQTTLPNPIELRDYEVMTSPFFANDADLFALYNAMSNNQTWKVHFEVAGVMATQLRYAGTVNSTDTTPYFERYERHRLVSDVLENFTVANYKAKRYTPTEQGWYQEASDLALFNATNNTYTGIWSGPAFQGTGAGAGTATYGLEPVMTYLKKVLWRDTTKHSVFKLKILTTSINALLQGLSIPETDDIAIVNSKGEIAGYRYPGVQVIPNASDPSNAKLAKLGKIWSVGHFSIVTASDIKTPVSTRLDLGEGVSIFPLDEEQLPGFRIVTRVVASAPYRTLFDVLLVLAALMILLSILGIIYSTLSVQKRMEEASGDALGRLLADLLPAPIATKFASRVVWPISETFPACTLLFGDVLDFTERAAIAPDPTKMVAMWTRLVEEFDLLSHKHNVEKVKTVGDCYVAVSGAPIASSIHATSMLRFALAMLGALDTFNADGDDPYVKGSQPIRMRIGVNSGAAIGAVLGSRRFFFDIFGSTVDIARGILQSAGSGKEVVCSSATKQCVDAEASLTPRKSTFGPAKETAYAPAAVGFTFSSEESVQVDGVAEPVACHYVEEHGADGDSAATGTTS